MIKLSRFSFVLLLLVVLVSGILIAQTRETGTIEGTISDQEGVPLPGVTVTGAVPTGERMSTPDITLVV